MRYLLPVALAAATIAPGAAPAVANEQKKKKHHVPERARAHLSLHVSGHHAMAGDELVVRGRLRPGGRHRVKVVVRGPSGGQLRARTGRDGRFRTTWRLPANGVHRVRAFGIHDRRVTGSASVARHVTVYRAAHASYYGPGLYGGALACGGTLQPGTQGVAHKTLPCGTSVRLRYRGRTITVPVVDRGPYVGGREFDLTEATKARLRFPDLGTVLSSR
jgi:rare lipoprotein A